MKFALTPDNFEHTLGVIVIDMAEPWTIMENLNKWTEVLRRHIDTLRIPPEKMQEWEQRCKCYLDLLLFVRKNLNLYSQLKLVHLRELCWLLFVCFALLLLLLLFVLFVFLV